MRELLRNHSFSIAFVLVLGVFIFAPFRGGEDIQQLSGYTMGTTYHFQFADMPSNFSRIQIQEDLTTLLNTLDRQLFSTYVPESELSRFNRSPVNSRFMASTELIEVIALAQDISRSSNGAFDVTVGPLVNLWGFGPVVNASPVPDVAQITAAKEKVGYQHLKVNIGQSWLSKEADIYVDLSAIAKGYSVDQVANYFDSVGITSYFLDIGGELKIKGLKPGNQNWVPAVERPVDTAPQVYQVLNSRGEEIAIAGSGDYRNYFKEDGVRYSHEIDPRTGLPVSHRLAAVYVIDSSTARADALATAFMVLGYEQGMVLAKNIEQAVYFIVRTEDGDFTSFYTDQFARYIDSVK